MPVLLFCVIILFLIFKFKVKLLTKEEEKEQEEWLQLEKKASLPIKKSLKDLPLIQIDPHQLPFKENASPELKKIQETILALSKEPLCNLSDSSSTTLKLKYGAKNLPLLAEYEQNYILLIRTLADWCEQLALMDQKEDAIQVANFAIHCRSDIRKTYTVLARIYKEQGNTEKIYELLPVVEKFSNTIDLKKVLYDVINEYE